MEVVNERSESSESSVGESIVLVAWSTFPVFPSLGFGEGGVGECPEECPGSEVIGGGRDFQSEARETFTTLPCRD